MSQTEVVGQRSCLSILLVDPQTQWHNNICQLMHDGLIGVKGMSTPLPDKLHARLSQVMRPQYCNPYGGQSD